MTKRKTLTAKQKAQIMDAHGGTCWRCGEGFADGEKIEFDHKQALARGGSDTPDNIGPAHLPCHKLKTFGTKARRLESDIFEAAKTKRLAKKHGGERKAKHTWPARKMGNPKLRKKLNGKVEPYDGPARMS